jgi:hypothetical protein
MSEHEKQPESPKELPGKPRDTKEEAFPTSVNDQVTD